MRLGQLYFLHPTLFGQPEAVFLLRAWQRSVHPPGLEESYRFYASGVSARSAAVSRSPVTLFASRLVTLRQIALCVSGVKFELPMAFDRTEISLSIAASSRSCRLNSD